MTDQTDLIALTADIVSAHVGHNTIETGELPELIASVYAALAKAGSPLEPEAVKAEPAVPIRSSVKHDYIVCLEDGKKLKMLKRYLRTNYQMTPEEYRAKWGLSRDYPMVAPAYADQRRTMAKSLGLGRKAAADTADAVEPVVETETATAAPSTADAPAPKKRGRPAKALAAVPALTITEPPKKRTGWWSKSAPTA